MPAVVDDDGRKLYPLGQAAVNDPFVDPYEWSADNLKEVGNGLLRRADSVTGLAALIGADPDTVAATLERWNATVAAGADDDHGRPDSSLFVVKKPPFYVGTLWPVVNNTQGGPAHDARLRVVTPMAIPSPASTRPVKSARSGASSTWVPATSPSASSPGRSPAARRPRNGRAELTAA